MAARPSQGSYPRPGANPYASPYGAPAQPPAPARNNTPLIIGGVVAAVLLLVAIGVIAKVVSKPRRATTALGDAPANFFQQATADFAAARQALADGKLTESMEKFAESQHHRARAAKKSVSAAQTFEDWCAAKEKEYRAAALETAAALPQLVGKPGGPTIAEADTFLATYGTPAERAAWERQRGGLERRSATAAADSAHRIEWIIQSIDTTATEDMNEDDRKPLADAIAARMGNGTPVPLVPASAAPGVPPDQGVGYVRVELQFIEAPYVSKRDGREHEIKVPAMARATIDVKTNKAPGPYDGVHQHTAMAEPPKSLIENDIATTRARLQAALVKQIVDQVSGKTAPPGKEPAPTIKPTRRR